MSTPRGYKKYSHVASGGIIYENPKAPPQKRWLLEHDFFGDKYFTNHDDILLWTVEETRRRFKRLMEPPAPRGGDDIDGQHRPPGVQND